MEAIEEVVKSITKLRKAWEIAPAGSKKKVEEYGFSNQNTASILKKGRKKDFKIDELLQAIKRASAEIAQDVNERNNQVQSL